MIDTAISRAEHAQYDAAMAWAAIAQAQAVIEHLGKTNAESSKPGAADLGRAVLAHVAERVKVDDDAGCDWITDGDGVYIADLRWHVSTDPQVTALVDAANILIYGHALHVTEAMITAQLEHERELGL